MAKLKNGKLVERDVGIRLHPSIGHGTLEYVLSRVAP
jgi:hypothetical protein